MNLFGLTDQNSSKRAFWTILYALHAMDAFRAVFSVPRIVRDVDIHRTYPLAFPAGDTFLLIASYP